ncbi:MAG: prolyl oligopeptidase family serine peptidase [bacterium]
MKKRNFLLIFAALCVCSSVLVSQEPYKHPPQEVIDIVDAPPTPRAVLSPTGRFLMLAEYEAMPSIATMAQPLLRIAGTRITPQNNSRMQTLFYTGLVLKDLKDGTSRRVALPEGVKMGAPSWSYDDRWIAFTRYLDDGVELWIVDSESCKATALTGACINVTIGRGFRWMPDNKRLLADFILDDRGNPPEAPSVPVGPTIQETSGKFSKEWTYQDLLQNSHDEDLFDYYTTSQLMEIDVQTGSSRSVGPPGIYEYAIPSPDGKYILVHKIKKPYSYMVPYSRFTHTVEVWDRDGNLVHLLADLPLADEVPMRGVETGVRSIEWRPLEPATLVWAEALDGGDPENDVPHRDKIMTLSAPFKSDPKEVIRITHRYSGISWLEKKGAAFVTEYDWKRRWRTTYSIDFDRPKVIPKKIFDINTQDRYNDPGYPVSKTLKNGVDVVLQDKDWIYLSGSGASPKGDLPFLDKMNLKSMKKERLYRCAENSYETFSDFVGDKKDRIITQYESKTEPPNYFIVDLKTKKRSALTEFKDPAPQLTGLTKELIKYKRADGVDLSGTLYLPPDYKEGQRLPLVIWAYPIEYSDPSVAGQVRGSPHRFTFFRGTSQLFFVTQGYALLDGAQMPVVGDPKTMNDTFIDQIVGSAKAAIDKLDEMGVIDPKRVGVGGHSYGAFMTANLLAHCDLFAAGLARSGAYNRTLTPFGFQSERRTFWEVPEIYFKLSPFMHANKINEPILLIHGEADNNSGTFPIQSQRMYHALKGHGATTRLVMLPHESHGYRARESVLHVLAEMFEWMDTYVKNR